METFELLKKYLRFLGCTRHGADLHEKIFGIAVICALSGVYLIGFLTTFWYFAFDAETFMEHAESLFYVLSAALVLMWYANIIWQKNEFNNLFDELNETIESRISNAVLNTIYRKTNIKIAKLSKLLHSVFIQVQLPFFLLCNITVSTYEYFSSGYSNESFHLIHPASYPFNWRTPAGYLASSCIQIMTTIPSTILYASILISTLGFCLFAIDFVNDIEENLRQLNDFLVTSEDEELIGKERLNIKKQLTDIMIFHSQAKELTHKFCRINNGNICGFLLYAFLSVCSLMLQVNTLLKSGDSVGITQAFVPVSLVMGGIFLFCYYGDRMTQRFEEIADKMYQIQWYRLCLDEQKYLTVAIAVAEKRVYLQGFGSISCTREIYYQIMNTAFSYFLVLREFA